MNAIATSNSRMVSATSTKMPANCHRDQLYFPAHQRRKIIPEKTTIQFKKCTPIENQGNLPVCRPAPDSAAIPVFRLNCADCHFEKRIHPQHKFRVGRSRTLLNSRECRAFLGWRRGYSRRKQRGNVIGAAAVT